MKCSAYEEIPLIGHDVESLRQLRANRDQPENIDHELWMDIEQPLPSLELFTVSAVNDMRVIYITRTPIIVYKQRCKYATSPQFWNFDIWCLIFPKEIDIVVAYFLFTITDMYDILFKIVAKNIYFFILEHNDLCHVFLAIDCPIWNTDYNC